MGQRLGNAQGLGEPMVKSQAAAQVRWFFLATVMSYHTLSGFKQHTFIVMQFKKSDLGPAG